MNSHYYHHAVRFPAVFLGLATLFCAFHFVKNVNGLAHDLHKMNWPYWLGAIIFTISSGTGITLGFLIPLNCRSRISFITASLIFATYFSTLQLYLTIAPAMSGCKCTTLSEAILNITDWNRVTPALGLLTLNIVAWILFRKPPGNRSKH